MRNIIILLLFSVSIISVNAQQRRFWALNGQTYQKSCSECVSFRICSVSEFNYRQDPNDVSNIFVSFPNGSYSILPRNFLDSTGTPYGSTVNLAIANYQLKVNVQSIQNGSIATLQNTQNGAVSISFPLSSILQSNLTQDDILVPSAFYSGFIEWINPGIGTVIINTSGGGYIELNSVSNVLTFNPNAGIKYLGVSINKSLTAKIRWSFSK